MASLDLQGASRQAAVRHLAAVLADSAFADLALDPAEPGVVSLVAAFAPTPGSVGEDFGHGGLALRAGATASVPGALESLGQWLRQHDRAAPSADHLFIAQNLLAKPADAVMRRAAGARVLGDAAFFIGTVGAGLDEAIRNANTAWQFVGAWTDRSCTRALLLIASAFDGEAFVIVQPNLPIELPARFAALGARPGGA